MGCNATPFQHAYTIEYEALRRAQSGFSRAWKMTEPPVQIRLPDPLPVLIDDCLTVAFRVPLPWVPLPCLIVAIQVFEYSRILFADAVFASLRFVSSLLRFEVPLAQHS